MVLSNEGIKRALDEGALEISPVPDETQYTTSAVDLHLGEEFNVWDAAKFKVPGFKAELDLSTQQFNETARAYLVPLEKERDGSVIFPPYNKDPWHLLAITRERVHLKTGLQTCCTCRGEKLSCSHRDYRSSDGAYNSLRL